MSDIPNVKMDISRMGDNELQELFENAFRDQIAEPLEIDDPEVECERQSGSNKFNILINITGFAGTPTANQYATSDVDVSRVVIARADKGSLVLNYNAEKTASLGGIDYQVVYESE